MANLHQPQLLIQAEALTVGHNKCPVARDLSFTAQSGEFWFLVGSNGCGKSTTLRTLLGFHKPLQGKVILNPALNDRSRIGYVPQRSELNPSIPTTVREFVLLGLVGSKISPSDKRCFEEAISISGLDGREDHSYWNLSGGFRQRASLARALIRRPRLLILDEPLVGLDRQARASLLSALQEQTRSGELGILCVSHSAPVVQQYATHLLLFSELTAVAGPKSCVEIPTELELFFN